MPRCRKDTLVLPISPSGRHHFLQFRDVKFFHFQERFCDARNLLLVFFPEHLSPSHGGHDLPREPEFIFEPAALLRLWRRSKFVPVVVNFLLGVAVYDQRDCLVECEVVPAGTICRRERLSFQGECRVF